MIDICLLFNELDMLELRLRELNDVVDQFIVIQGEETFSGKDKPLYLDLVDARWAPWAGRLSTVVVPKTEARASRWDREYAARDHVAVALAEVPRSQLVIYSDVDEIPDVSAIQEWVPRITPKFWVTFRPRVSMYYANLQSTEPWAGIALATAFTFQRFGGKRIRDWRRRMSRPVPPGVGGWHLTYMGGVDQIQKKIQAWTHGEFDHPRFTDPERIAERIVNRRDVFDRGRWHMQVVPLTALPRTIQQHPDQYASWLLPEEPVA